MRPVSKTTRTNDDGSPLTFKHWGDAKNELQAEIGSYCSFCEREGYRSSLDVEHILAKSLPKYNDHIYRWDNFLLGCKNCNSTKGSKDYDTDETYMPHINNLFHTLDIMEGGVIQIKEGITEEQKRRTKNFVDLVGLDRNQSHPDYSNKDDRWESRIKVWGIANNFRKDYDEKAIKLERIVETAQGYGYWSVWMTVFNQYPEVKKELINQFPGTTGACFDIDYKPLTRN
jgi:uncharacterized protein (TIGR02646 family)